MPINEAAGYHSNLSQKEQKEAAQAIYGLGGPMSEAPMTYEERVRMRRVLDDLDQKEAGGMREFDLNKPPVKAYVYQEYPRLMYNHGNVTGPDASKKIKPAPNYQQHQTMLAQGWREDPPGKLAAPVEVELTAEEEKQARKINRRLKMPKEQLEAEMQAERDGIIEEEPELENSIRKSRRSET